MPKISFLLIVMLPITNVMAFSNRIIAHRGAWKEKNLPQNSLSSLREAILMKCFGSEFDIRMTKDNKLVILHDAEHHGLKVEKNFYKDLAKYPLSNGEKLPLLKDYLDCGLKDPDIKLILEIKPSPAGSERGISIAKKALEEVRKRKALQRVVFISFDLSIIEMLSKVEGLQCQYLNGELSPLQLSEKNIMGLDYNFRIFDKNLDILTQSKSLGVTTNSWTVNDEAMIRKLFVYGIDFITTDVPRLALKIDHELSLSRWKLVWGDEFSKDGLPDENIWTYDEGGHGWGNSELQYYTSRDTNTTCVKNGFLTITASKVDSNTYHSARLVTRGRKSIRHGRVEIRAKLPWGRGIWPAIWMLGDNISQVGWPSCGEIDIMEHVGYDPDTLVGSIHTYHHNHLKGTQRSTRIKFRKPYDRFHNYAVEYDEREIKFFLNENNYYSIKREEMKDWPFDEPMHLLMNIAVGGSWGGLKGVDQNIFPQDMVVDYVRVFQLSK
jgi:beta-glucanase (GH16 family)